MTPIEHNGWDQYQRLVIFRLNQQDENFQRLERKVDQIQTAVTVLKVKAAIYGAMAGAVASALAALGWHGGVK